jgi:hypothetical protein
MVFFLPPPHYTPPPSGEHRYSPPPLFPSSAGESASLAFNVEDEREGAQAGPALGGGLEGRPPRAQNI